MSDDDTRPIVITLHVDAALAVRAGHGRAGTQKLELRAPELAQLTHQQRDTLARHIGGESAWSRPLNRHAERIGTADLPTLAKLLDARARWLAPDEVRVFHCADMLHPERYDSRAPWYFEPTDSDGDVPFSRGYATQQEAIAAALAWADAQEEKDER